MTLQNRVTPFGEIVTVPFRGALTGNRGIIHDPVTRTLLKRRWSSHAWIICLCEFKARRRDVMAHQSWTELFFFDEATALAAGHRPCFFCQRQRARSFQAAWAQGNEISNPSAPAIDVILHGERLDTKAGKKLHALQGPIAGLPDGTMIASGENAYVMKDRRTHIFSWEGYTRSELPSGNVALLTPPSTVRALKAGYKPFVR